MPGVLILAGLTVTSTLVFFMDSLRRALLEGPRIVVLAAEARGLAPGADVWIAGSPSGRVTGVRLGDPDGPERERVVIDAVLYWTAVPYLRDGATARVGSSALLAPVVLKLAPGDVGSGPFDPSDTLHVIPNQTRDQLLASAAEGKAAADTVTELLAALADRLEHGPGTLTRLRQDSTLWGNSLRTVGVLSATWKSRETLPSRLARDSVSAALARITTEIHSLATDDDVTRATDAVGALLARLERISERLAVFETRLQEGFGTAGRAVYDDEIRRQKGLLQTRLDSARSELSDRPWRWLRFKLF